MTIPDKLQALRTAMRRHGIDAYLIGSSDPHSSEYAADRWQGRAWLSGFTGSAGTLIVLDDWAGLWTDSRYFIQAEQELADSGIELMRLRVPHTPEYRDFLTDKLEEGQTLGYAGTSASLQQAETLENKLRPEGIEVNPGLDLLDEIWRDRPAPPQEAVYAHEEAFADAATPEKITRLRQWMAENELDYYLLTALDEIAWLLNVRGRDIAYNPVVVSYLGIPAKGPVEWFAGRDRIDADWAAKYGVKAMNYGDTIGRLMELRSLGVGIGLDPATANLGIYQAAGSSSAHRLASPIPAWKARKNDKASRHMQQALTRDALALLRLRRWLDTADAQGRSEYDIVQKLSGLRGELLHYQGDSFGAIVGYESNGAIVHYSPPVEGSARLGPRGMLLIDSGGQYLDGTTDITRTFCLGEPTAEERRHFTLVLQGMIDLSMARFPVGTTGVQLDILARQPLWSEGLNYGHGTGHGVGYFLNVHEGPAAISPNPKSKATQHVLQPGMILSNEPGYYPQGQYGIRCENLIQVVETEQGWLAFDTMTLFPFEQKLIDLDLMSDKQIQWLDRYHARVLREVEALIENQEEMAWLQEACRRVGP